MLGSNAVREITYKQLMIIDLQKMRDWRFSVTQMQEELATLEQEYATIKVTNYDKMPSGSGDNTQEEKMLSAIAKRDQKQAELDLTKRRIADLERLLDQLNDHERLIIQRMVIDRGRADALAEELHCEVRQVYNRKNAALAHLVRLRHGAAYHE